MARKGKKTQAAARVRKLTKRQQKTVEKKKTRDNSKIPTSFKLIRQVSRLLWQNWLKLLGIVVVYLILNVIFASGFGSLTSNISSLKTNLQSSTYSLSHALGNFGTLIGTGGTFNSQTGTILQTFLIVFESLVIIWALRQLYAAKKIGVKQAYYASMYPLIPFFLVIVVILFQLLPVILGSALASTILSAIFNSSGTLSFVFGCIVAVLAAWSIYMISSSIFALYIVTLPDMEPLKAVQSAKNLVRYRRWIVLRRLLFLPIFIFVVMALIMVPLVLYATFFAAPFFYFLSMVAILFAHSYLYSLYRGLLD